MKKPSDKPTSAHPESTILGVYEANLGALKRFISRLLNGQHDVDDVVQEAFLRAFNAENGKPIQEPKSYLFRIAKNVALNQLRQKTRRPTDFLEDFDSPDVLASDWTLEDEIMAHQKLGVHCAAVAALPPKCRKVYLMRKVYAMSYKEIADALDITLSTVETHMEKGFARCQAYVEEHLGEVTGGSPNTRRSTPKHGA